MSNNTPDRACAECGMICAPGEFHPYAACLMFKACHDGDVVRANLRALDEGAALAAPSYDTGMLQVAVAPCAAAGIGPTAMRPATAEEAAHFAARSAALGAVGEQVPGANWINPDALAALKASGKDWPEPDKYVDCGEVRPLPMYHLHTLLRHRDEYASRAALAATPREAIDRADASTLGDGRGD